MGQTNPRVSRRPTTQTPLDVYDPVVLSVINPLSEVPYRASSLRAGESRLLAPAPSPKRSQMQTPIFAIFPFRALSFFLERLKPFLDDLPKGYKWAVEIRNKIWLSE
jgi:hypothetical protein